MYLPLEVEESAEEKSAVAEEKKKAPTTSYAEDVLNKINQARDDKVLAAIMEGKES